MGSHGTPAGAGFEGPSCAMREEWIMDEFETSKSCWGITVRAVAVFAGIVAFTAALSDEGSLEIAAGDEAAAVVATR